MMHVKLVCYEAEPGRGRKKKKKNPTQLVREHTVEQREGVLKLLDKDMFNWAVDNSFFSCFTGRHSAALKSVVKRGRKGWVGATCEEHKHTHMYRQTHTHTQHMGSHGSGGTWRRGLNLFNCSPH